MVLATDRVGMNLLVTHGMFTGNDDDATKEAVIFGREIPTSLIIMRAGFRLDCLAATHFQRATTFLKRNAMGDIIQPGAYLGRTLEPYDLCFFKTNRGCSAEAVERCMRLADYKSSVRVALPPTSLKALASPTKRVLIVFAYYETPDGRRNLGFFCRHGVSPDNDRQYMFVLNGECTIEDQIPRFANVTILRRPNRGFDFGAWAHALREKQADAFDYFCFLNTSVAGPFLPAYQDPTRWLEPFVTRLNDQVKLVGLSADIWQGSLIVHSMLLCTDRVGLECLHSDGIFTDNDEDGSKAVVIHEREIQASKAITRRGFAVNSLDLLHEGRALTDLQRESKGDGQGDVFQPHSYPLGYTVEPLDTLFFKTNQGLSTAAVDRGMQIADYKRSKLAETCLQDTRILRTIARIKQLPTAWQSHIELAVWLTARFLPQVIVDLSVHDGASTYAWGIAGVSSVVGIVIDSFESAMEATIGLAADLTSNFGYPNNVQIRKVPSFAEASNADVHAVDVLHIDGRTPDLDRHLQRWIPKLAKDGIVALHGTRNFPSTVGKLFRQLAWAKINFDHGSGFGIASRDETKIATIAREWKDLLYRQDADLRHRDFDDIRMQL